MNRKVKKNNKGFSLVELIIVLAIMAVLMAVMVPVFLQYVGWAKRTSDVASAKQIVEAMDMQMLTTNKGIVVGGMTMVGFKWNKNTKPNDDPDDLYVLMLASFKGVPVSNYNEDFWWCIFYTENDEGYLQVNSLYLLENRDDTKGYELYPDSTKYVEKMEKVNVTFK